jgi:endonuclease YncB( thermonuclease family)
MRGVGKFWVRPAWEAWAADRRLWRSYKAAIRDLDSRIAVTRAALGSSQQQAAKAQRILDWVDDIHPRELPIDLKKNEVGLVSIPQVTLLETRRRDGQNVWVPLATGSMIFTNRRAVFDGPKNVTFEYKNLTDATLGPRGLHLAVSSRKTSHLLAGPAEQLVITLEACRAIGRAADPIDLARRAERNAAAVVAGHQAALTDLNQARSAIRRPSRPWSPAWVPGLALGIALFAVSGMTSGAPISSAPTTTTSVTTINLEPGMATVASITDGDTIRVILPDGSNESVRLIGIDAPESGELGYTDSKDYLAGLLEVGQVVYLESDLSDQDRFGRLLRYVYDGETFVNEEMVESGWALAVEYPPNTAQADVLAEAQQRAEDAGRTTTTPAPTTTTTDAPTTTTAAPTTTTTAAPTTTTTLAPTTTTAAPTTTAPPASNCHSSYKGACLMVGQGDYDCAGGSGNGPNYVSGPISVVGYDEFDLDRDNDGIGCES